MCHLFIFSGSVFGCIIIVTDDEEKAWRALADKKHPGMHRDSALETVKYDFALVRTLEVPGLAVQEV